MSGEESTEWEGEWGFVVSPRPFVLCNSSNTKCCYGALSGGWDVAAGYVQVMNRKSS